MRMLITPAGQVPILACYNWAIIFVKTKRWKGHGYVIIIIITSLSQSLNCWLFFLTLVSDIVMLHSRRVGCHCERQMMCWFPALVPVAVDSGGHIHNSQAVTPEANEAGDCFSGVRMCRTHDLLFKKSLFNSEWSCVHWKSQHQVVPMPSCRISFLPVLSCSCTTCRHMCLDSHTPRRLWLCSDVRNTF